METFAISTNAKRKGKPPSKLAKEAIIKVAKFIGLLTEKGRK
tara:strand:+ start:4820 stop:4945 length:126 start_codon:yes stop_codon:yes gene_type:complete